MPAINLARLRIQAAALADLFDQPEAFSRALRDLLDYYADRVHRSGQAGEPPPIIQAYHVPAPMLRQIALELISRAGEDAARTLALSDALWAEPALEPRLLAATLLGQAPLNPVEAVLERVQRWAQSLSEQRLFNALTQQGLSRVSREQPDRLLQQTEIWLEEADISLKRLGFNALLPLISNPKFENLPAILQQFTPYIRIAPFPLRPEILDLLSVLAKRSPRETAYFLRQNLEAPDNPDTAWLTRQSLKHFPLETQASLRATLRQL